MATLNQISPFFIVENLTRSVEFYRDLLGFSVFSLIPDEDPFFAIVQRDGVMILLKDVAPDVAPQPNPRVHSFARWDAYISVDDPDELAAEFNGRGVRFRQALADTDDGLRGFEISDHDGYVIFFGRPR